MEIGPRSRPRRAARAQNVCRGEGRKISLCICAEDFRGDASRFSAFVPISRRSCTHVSNGAHCGGLGLYGTLRELEAFDVGLHVCPTLAPLSSKHAVVVVLWEALVFCSRPLCV